VDKNTSNQITVSELDREFIFLYAIATLARYRVNEWTAIISGKDNDLILKDTKISAIH
jgi:hypothetical protein